MSTSKKRMSILGLIAFAAHRRAERRILVFVNKRPREIITRTLNLAEKLGLIEIVHVKNTPDFYNQRDDEVTAAAREVADHVTDIVISSVLEKSEYKFDRYAVADISEGIKLRLWDHLYSRIHRILLIIDASRIPLGSDWIDYGNRSSILENQNGIASQGLSGTTIWPDTVKFISAKGDRIGRRRETVVLDILQERIPETLIFGTTFRPAYVASVEAVVKAELQMGLNVCVVMPSPDVVDLDGGMHNKKKRVSKVLINLPEPDKPWRVLQLSLREDVETQDCHASLNKSDPILAARFGINGEVWFGIILSQSLSIMNTYLEAVSEFYDSIVNGKEFDQLSAAIFVPSRSVFHLPILFALKRRGVQLIEYQPFFWSAHPRYIVQDIDLFVCSDGATQNVIASKVAAKCFSAKIVPGPSFGIAGFLADFREISKSPQPVGQSRLIGLALQPVNQDIFLAACKLIIEEGFEVVIRPHPSQSLRDVEALFGSYGPIDTGTLASFVHRSFIVVTGFSNVALQTALVGRTAVCLPVPNELGLNLADASDRILICEDFEDLRKFLHQPVENSAAVTFPDPIDQWCEIRRENR